MLGQGESGFVREVYANSRPAPINVDWKTSRVNVLIESVASRARPRNFFVYSIRRIQEGILNDVNFESPFAFYQLSPRSNTFPDLTVRIAYWPTGDWHPHMPVEQVDYSWRQTVFNNGLQPQWDYSVGLLGHNAHQGEVVLPEFSLRLTPYDQIPTWVTGQDWDFATMVAREEGDYPSSEGMYEWRTLEGVIDDVRDPDQVLLKNRVPRKSNILQV